MSKRVTIFVGEHSGFLEPSCSGRTITIAKMRVLASGEFARGDQWEKAVRHGWRIVECFLTPRSPAPRALHNTEEKT